MNTTELLKSVIDWREKFTGDEKFLEKLVGDPQPGDKIQIRWKERKATDYGYIFTLPGMDAEQLECLVHVPQPDNSDGMDNAEEVYSNLLTLLSFDILESILIIKK